MAKAHRTDDNEGFMNRQRVLHVFVLLLASALLNACSAEDIFTQGRVNEPCSGVYPTCHTQFAAGCYLDEDRYTEGQFPGARRVLVTTNQASQTIRVRLFLRSGTMLFPGTEILVQAWEPDCGDVERDHRLDVDIFEEAGDDLTLLFDLPAASPGDHLIELYSDSATEYLLSAEQL
jgi:hypothetical protein